MKKKIAAGIMSGTSLDGVDVAIAEIQGFDKETNIKMIAAKTFDWPKDLKLRIEEVMSIEKSNVAKISSLNFEIAKYYSKVVDELCRDAGINKLDFVASHGQTIWHQPTKDNNYIESTLQIGDGSVISQMLKTTVVYNFRTADMAVGGQGAPLVPFVDEMLFKEKNRTVALHNLGGISNTTILPKETNGQNGIAFDTGPANMMIDRAMKLLFNKNYDHSGEIARQGKKIDSMYDEVMNLEYFELEPPKSTGRELFGNQYTDYLINKYKENKKEDIVNTLTQITIESIVDSYLKIEKNYGVIDEIIFSGGGAHNEYILEEVQKRMVDTKISKLEKHGMSSDFKEALAFIILGNQTLNKKASNAIYATGARKNVILGQVCYYK